MGNVKHQQQRDVLAEATRSLEAMSATLKSQVRRLASHAVLPSFVRALLLSAQTALDDATIGLLEWADGVVDEDGVSDQDGADTLDLDHDHDDDRGN